MINLVTYLNKLFSKPVLEMAKINTKDNLLSYFPWNKYEIYVHSNDHNPPHFHIVSRSDTWDIRIEIESGNLYSVKKIW